MRGGRAGDATELINELQPEPVIRALSDQPEAWLHAADPAVASRSPQ
jgi:hypothetical protein